MASAAMAPEEWRRRAAAWSAAHGIPASLWLGPDLDPLPEPPAATCGASADPGAGADAGPAASPDPQKENP